MSAPTPLHPLQTWWNGLALNEKTGIQAAVALMLVALVWFTLLGPGLNSLRTADSNARALDAQWQHMQGLQQQAQALQAQPSVGFDDAVRALAAATQNTLGATGQLSVNGDRATVTLIAAAPDALAQWLNQARVNARSVPSEARLTRATGTDSTTNPVVWNGTLLMSLPAK